MGTRNFYQIFAAEIKAINLRRKAKGRSIIRRLENEGKEHDYDKTPILRPQRDDNIVGLALSGGGIRSAAFCLGVLQALDARDEPEASDAQSVLDKIDYLSTVSGGGYIGASMTAAMNKSSDEESKSSDGEFPFKSKLLGDEVPGVQHIRDYSNYLFPKGLTDVFKNVAVYLRGLMANVVLLLLPGLLFTAAVTVWLFHLADDPPIWLSHFADYLPIQVSHFVVTLYCLFVLVALFVFWALWRSFWKGQNRSDVGFGSRMFGRLLAAILVIGFIELQPFLLRGMLEYTPDPKNAVLDLVDWLKKATALLAPIGAVVSFLGRFLGDALKQASEKPGFWALPVRIATKLAMYIAGASVLAVLWVAYLYLSYWGICACADTANCASHTPSWLSSINRHVWGGVPMSYFTTGAILLILSLLLEPNANSLHRLYRDRLSKAFLFDPDRRMEPKHGKIDQKSDLQPLDDLISQFRCTHAPYHLINAALNIEASQDANRRGRNADFFIFSRLYIGSRATGYVRTKRMEKEAPDLTMGAAMAISGAAASANMGSATIKPLVPALAMLNIRLGYWLPNPAKVAGTLKTSRCRRVLEKLHLSKLTDKRYFFKELLGLLDEKSPNIYLTDGGHIENLGIYELLRRRCQLIIAVDAEADPEMSFRSLVTLERYARIDFGIRIELPWQKVRDATHKASEEILHSNKTPSNKIAHGPHCALGIIYYPHQKEERDEDRTGLLLYIKSSITGDESDYIMDYKRRNSDFPHETTADQMFSEEQFEVYRALGFHAAHRALDDDDEIAMDTTLRPENLTPFALKKRLLKILKIDKPATGWSHHHTSARR